MDCGLLIVERKFPGDANTERPLRDLEKLSAYRGFDGIVWPDDMQIFDLRDGLAPLAKHEEVKRHYQQLLELGNDAVDLIVICRGFEASLDSPISGFPFCGFDYGYFESEYAVFSVVLNDVIFGSQWSLHAFEERLNENLLFSSLLDVEELARQRRKLFVRGEDLEEEENHFESFAVFGVDKRR